MLFIRNGSSERQVAERTEYPVTRIETISDGSVNFNKVGYVKTIDESYEINNGDILFSNINSVKHIGKAAYFESTHKLYHGMNLLLLRFDPRKVDSLFGYYLIIFNKKWFENHAAKAVNQASINQGVLKSLPINLPSIIEQKKIAKILQSIDLAIKKTASVITQTEKIKRGLMQRFFMERKWANRKISDIAEVVTGGTPKTSVLEYWDGSIRWMSSGEVNLRRIRDTEKMITQKGFDNSNARLLPLGTVMVALAGQGKTRGKVAILEIETTCNQSLAGIISNKNILSNEFLFYNLEYRYQELRDISGGEGRAGLNLKLIKEFVVPVPPLQEQKKVAAVLTTIDEKISVNQKLKAELNILKKGLMQDLLSGRVRVTTT